MASALPYYIDLPEDRQDRARAALFRELGMTLDETQADAIIEQVWNALVGHEDEGAERSEAA